jgi:hypothetical protein
MISEQYCHDYDLDGHIYVPDVKCRFDLTYDGDAVTCCNLTHAVLGEYVAPRVVLLAMFGTESIARVEDCARDQYLEDLKT